MNTNFFRYTVWTDGKSIVDELGLIPDSNSRPELFEWYLTFDNENDSIAFGNLLFSEHTGFIKHGMSMWNIDPRLH